MARKRKKHQQSEEQSSQVEEQVLSEWQVRHKAYMDRKAKEEADAQEELTIKKKERLGQLDYDEADEIDVSEENLESAEEIPEEEADSEEKLDQEEISEGEKEPLTELSARELKRIAKQRKKAEKAAAKAKKEKERTIAKRHIYRAVPILLGAFLLALVSAYFMSPWASQKNFTVSGNQQVDTQTILDKSGIDKRDYTVTTYLSQTAYVRNMEAADPWIEKISMSYQFPTTFAIKVKEYDVVAYAEKNNQFYPVLSNGVEIEQAVPSDQLPESYLTIKISNLDLLKKCIQQLAGISSQLKSEIGTISLTPSKATGDLLTVEMTDGNRILVPLDEIQKKLPYYTVIREKLQQPSVVDLEAGAYSYPIQAPVAESTDETSSDLISETPAEESLATN